MTWPDTMLHLLEVAAGPEGSLDRMHRSGDFGRYVHNSIVECSGRAQDQDKMRGFLIELGKIGTHLIHHAV